MRLAPKSRANAVEGPTPSRAAGAVRYVALLALALGLTPATASDKSADTLTVVTLNLWHDQRDWPKRLSVILPELRRLKPDVLCLQEVLQHENLRNQAQTLADSLGCHFEFASVDSVESAKRYGNAVLTPHKVLASGTRNLEPKDDYRVVAHIRFEWRGRAVDAYSTHLHHTKEGGAIRATQIRHLLAYVDSTRGDGPLVLAGDFNAEPGTPEMELLKPRYVSAFRAVHPKATRDEAATYNKRFGPDPGQIDHIFTESKGRNRLRPVASEVLFRSPGPDSVWATDHFGLAAKLASER